MAYPPGFLDEIRARVSLEHLVGRKVKLVKRGREYVGLSPFQNEKSPSFTVVPEKGFYHCFSSGEHGDHFTWLMKVEGLSFPEAVERLAGEAGMEVPRGSREAEEEASRLKTLHEVMDQAVKWFQAQLGAGVGKVAREYLAKRGLSAETQKRFRLGFAPGARTGLKEALLARGVTEDQLIATGLVIKPEEGGASFDRFRDRVMFPITDARGRTIAFGGRILGDGKPKYLNSPDTVLFHKGKVLFGLFEARGAIRESGTALIAEGYMDVIGLAQAGFNQAVAPLGTALTEDQVQLLWRLAPEPVVCLDGDAAGQRAALSVADKVLPLLKPGQSLRFAHLPAGEDPDSLIKAQGASAMKDVIERAVPLADLLWQREHDQQVIDSPEREAGLKGRLEALARRVADPEVREAYQRSFRARFAAEFRRQAPAGDRPPWRGDGNFRRGEGRDGRTKFVPPLAGATSALRNSALGRGLPGTARERSIIGLVLLRPELLGRVEETFADMHLDDANLDRLRRAIVEVSATAADLLDSGNLHAHLREHGIGDLAERVAQAARPLLGLRADKSLDEVEVAWRGVLSVQERPLVLGEAQAAAHEYAEDSSDEKRDALVELRLEEKRKRSGQGESS